MSGDKKNFKRKPLGKWTLRFIALFVASTLWFYVVNSEPVTIERKVALTFVTPEGMAIANMIDWQVDLRLEGARAFIQNIYESNESVEVNLTTYNYTPGEHFEVRIGPGDIPVPFGVEVVDVSPASFEVSLEQSMEKEVDIAPQFIGSLPEGLRFVHQSLTPSRVRVNGPQSMIRGLERIRTAPIDLSGLRNAGSLEIRAQSPDRRIEVLTEGLFEFEYEVRPEQANITLTNIPVHFFASVSSFQAEQRHVALDVMAPEGEERRLRRGEVRVIAEVPEGASGTVSVPLRAELPEGVFLLKIHPEKIDVTIEE